MYPKLSGLLLANIMQPGRRVTRGSLKIEAMVKMSMTGTPNRARIVITEGCQLKRLPAESRKTLR
ncbi:hypothetical protein OAF38_00440, partial [bacterium]|nr:hypothetical protein [bacterium]